MNMKSMKLIAAMVAACLAVVGIVVAGTSTVTNELGQVITVVTDNYGVHITDVTVPSIPATQSQVYMNFVGFRIQPTATTNPAAFVPRQIGDVVINRFGTTNGGVWIANGITTKDWVPLYQP